LVPSFTSFPIRSVKRYKPLLPSVSIAAMKTAFLALLASATSVLGHGGVLSYIIGGTKYVGFSPYNSPSGQSTIQREWDSYNPIQDPTIAGMACNLNGAVAAKSASVAAGSVIVANWNNPWPHNIGPMVVWMANCGGSCASFNPTGKVWFKIQQTGLVSGTLSSGLWGSGEMIQQNSTWTVTIPKTLKPGNYLIRHETIALHTSNAPQW
jgi:cellulase